MQKLHTAKTAIALLCALLLGAASCSGGGGDGGGGGGGGTSPPPPPPPPPPSPPPPPPPNEPPLPPPGVLRPTLFLEHDRDGTAYLRVLETRFDPFAPGAPQRTIANQSYGPAGGSDNEIQGNQTTAVLNVDVLQMKHGLQILGTNTIWVYDYTYNDWDGDGSVHGAGIKIGDNNQPTNGAAYIQRAFIDGFVNSPDPTFNVSNTDAIGVETNSGPLYVRDVTGRRFGDAMIDTKSGPFYIMNATLTGGNSVLKLWEGVEIFIVNSIVNTSSQGSQIEFNDDPGNNSAAGFVRYYNTLFCINADVPSPSHPNCSTTPSPNRVSGEELTPQEAFARVTALASNTLPGVSGFFATQVQRIVLQYSTDGGANWQDMNVPNTGATGSAPIGDPRYRIPLDLSTANFIFRARYEANGAQIGETSLVINEAGGVVP